DPVREPRRVRHLVERVDAERAARPRHVHRAHEPAMEHAVVVVGVGPELALLRRFRNVGPGGDDGHRPHVREPSPPRRRARARGQCDPQTSRDHRHLTSESKIRLNATWKNTPPSIDVATLASSRKLALTWRSIPKPKSTRMPSNVRSASDGYTRPASLKITA